MNTLTRRLVENKWSQELFILLMSFVLFTLNDWILIHNWRSLLTGLAYFLLLYTHAQVNRTFLLPI